MADGKITVTFKEGTGFDSPWIVVSGDTVPEVRDGLGAIEQSGLMADVGRVAASFRGVAALGGTLGARPVAAPGAQTQQAPSQGAQTQQAAGSYGTAPAAPQNAPQAPQQGGPRVVKDNFGNEWEYDVPGAPDTPRGPAIVKRGKGQGGKKDWRKWYDPAQGPEWFTNRMPKVPANERWQGEFIN